MAKRYDNRKVIKRLANGACVMKRICNMCGKPFIGERNTCQPCRTKQRRLQRQQHRRRRSKIAWLHDAGTLSKKAAVTEARKAAFEKQKERIWAALRQINKTQKSASLF